MVPRVQLIAGNTCQFILFQGNRCDTTVPNVEIYHLERIVLVLDRPENYGVRQDFLGIDMTSEEMVAFFASIIASINEWQEFRSGEW